jgi:Cu-Zn family superoxide dismutase
LTCINADDIAAMMRRMLLLTLALAACGPTTEPRGGNDRVTAIFAHGFSRPIVGAAGKAIGSVTGRPDQQGLIVAFELSGLSPGSHAVHLTENGRCDPPDFSSSGGHWSRPGRLHGTDNPKGPHDGDWDNFDVAADGKGSSERLIPRWHSPIPQTGLAMVIHAGADDEVSQPEGNSGSRIACAVIIPPAQG